MAQGYATSRSGWAVKHLTIEEIIRAVRACERWQIGEKRDLAVLALRIATAFGDFQLDVFPEDGVSRYVMAISHYDISAQVAHLCEATSLYSIMPTRLNETLKELCSQFPEFLRE